MKKEELKQVLKPLIKQCIKEVIFEEGILSGIITEVVGGLSARNEMVVETRNEQPANSRNKEARNKLVESISKDAYNGVNVFENTEALSKGGSVNEAQSPPSSLSSYAPGDPGVNIEGLVSVAGRAWAKLK